MHDLMVGMFWGGLVMAIPPILVGIAIVAFLLNEHRLERSSESTRQVRRDR
jgi:hypothetical protein